MKTSRKMFFWTTQEVADFYRCTPSTILNWTKKNMIPYTILVNGAIRYDMEEVRKYAETESKAKESK